MRWENDCRPSCRLWHAPCIATLMVGASSLEWRMRRAGICGADCVSIQRETAPSGPVDFARSDPISQHVIPALGTVTTATAAAAIESSAASRTKTGLSRNNPTLVILRKMCLGSRVGVFGDGTEGSPAVAKSVGEVRPPFVLLAVERLLDMCMSLLYDVLRGFVSAQSRWRTREVLQFLSQSENCASFFHATDALALDTTSHSSQISSKKREKDLVARKGMKLSMALLRARH